MNLVKLPVKSGSRFFSSKFCMSKKKMEVLTHLSLINLILLFRGTTNHNVDFVQPVCYIPDEFSNGGASGEILIVPLVSLGQVIIQRVRKYIVDI